MDPDPSHIIRRQILEFRGARESDAQQLQDEVGKVFGENFLSLLDQYLSAQSPDDVVHRIDRLELDLGTISRNNLEEDCFRELTRQLEIYFQPQQQSEPDFKTEKAEISAEKSHLEIFRFFIETGSLPWWVDSAAADPVKESLDFLIHEQQSSLISSMFEWVHKPNALKRIVLQTGFPKWSELAAMNMECTAKELTSLLSQLMDLLKNITPWNMFSNHKLQENLGLRLLPWVYLSPRKTQNTPDFWRSFLVQLAAGQRVKYDELIAGLSQQFEKNRQGDQDDQLSVLFTFLWKGVTPAGSMQASVFEEIKHLLKVKALPPEQKIKWLEYLKLLNERVMEDEDLRAISQLLEQAVAVEPDKPAGRMPGESEPTEEIQFPYTSFWKGVTPAGSQQANLFEQIKDFLEVKALTPDQKIKWLEYLKMLNEQVLEAKDLRAISQLLERAEAAEPDEPAVGQPELIETSDMELDDFSDTDELYVGNAGLVILWPFLNRFFDNLNLLDDGLYADAAAAHRCVGLLQYLVDGQDMPAEHVCGLNKIFCGLDVDTVLEFGEPVTTEEAETCEELLGAVIANAPILGEMTPEGFRGSFLIRNGILRAGSGVWQLNVERETFDIVLERFPWSWSIVKLPWMEWAIDVEWV